VGQIGHAVARGLGRAGATLVLADVNAVGLADRVKEFAGEKIAAKASAGDLTQPEAGRAAVALAQAQFGGLDIVVNVAGGFFAFGPFTDVTPDALERELAINFKTAFYTSQAAIPALLQRGGGAIVNFASIAVLQPLMHVSAYTAAKSAVAGLTRELAREYADAGIRVNAVAPATVRTADNVAQMGDTEPLVALDDVVSTVLFLASDAAHAVSGQVIPLAGTAS
jgi:3-oxoacyl-[acyl-carrier protein] reductase